MNISLKQIKGNFYIYAEGWLEGKRVTKFFGSIYKPQAWREAFQFCQKNGLTRKAFSERLTEILLSFQEDQIKEILLKLLNLYIIAKYPQIKSLEEMPDEKERMETILRVSRDLKIVFLVMIFKAFATYEPLTMGVIYYLAKMASSPMKDEVKKEPKDIAFWEVKLQIENYEPEIFQIYSIIPTEPLRTRCKACGAPLENEAMINLIKDSFDERQNITHLSFKGSIFCYNCIRSFSYRATIRAKRAAKFLLDLGTLSQEELKKKYPLAKKIIEREAPLQRPPSGCKEANHQGDGQVESRGFSI